MINISKRFILYTSISSILFFSTGCEKVTKINNGLPTTGFGLSKDFVYDDNSPYKDVLKECIATDDETKSCSLNELPLIRDTGVITKEKIKERLVVSHKWMGDRFMEILDKLNSDILEMFGAVTAIVIDDDIRPAFYTTQTGAIYIDPRYIWLKADEAKDITKKEDFRSNYGNDLNFIPAWRYVKNSQPAIMMWDIENPQDRSAEDAKLNLARLLYHELTHANDFANKDVIDGANRDIPIVQALEERKEFRISNQLYQNYPLTQDTLKHLGKVLFFGDNATSDDKALEPNDVGALFVTDNANNMYNYANQYEDLAMLFESAMMKYHYDIEMDIAFVSNPNQPTKCDDFIVGWGVRNRIAKDSIKPRVKFVLNKILPNGIDWNGYVDNSIGSTTSLKSNVGWCSSIDTNNKSLRINNNKYTIEKIPYQDFRAPEI